MIEEMGKKTGAWTTDITYDASAISTANLAQYDAIFLSSTTGTFLDDPNDQAATDARRAGAARVRARRQRPRGNPRRERLVSRRRRTRTRRRAHPARRPPRAPPRHLHRLQVHAPAARRHAQPAGAGGGGGRGPTPPCSSNNPTPGGGGGKPLWPDFNKMIGGYFKFHWNYPTPITVKIDDPKSPINAAFKGKSFNTIDEVYTFNEASWSRENVHVLTSIDYSLMSDCDKGLESSPRPDKDFGLSWIRREGNGRVFYQALGHHESIYYNNPAMLEHILAGMQYALGDLKADDSPSKKK